MYLFYSLNTEHVFIFLNSSFKSPTIHCCTVNIFLNLDLIGIYLFEKNILK